MSWVAGETSARDRGGSGGSDEREGAVGGDTLDSFRILVSRIAGVSSAGGRSGRRHQRESTISRNARGSIRITVSWVAGKTGARGLGSSGRSDERKGAVRRNTLDSLWILVGRIAGVRSRRGCNRAGEGTGGTGCQSDEGGVAHGDVSDVKASLLEELQLVKRFEKM